MYLYLGTTPLISLMELGLFIKIKKMVIYCPDGFYRRGNMQVICDKYSGKLVEILDKLVKEVKNRMKYCKGSSNNNTVRQHIRRFDCLLLDAKQGLIQGFCKGGSSSISSQILFNLILTLVLTSPLKLVTTDLLSMLEEQKQQLLYRHRFYLYIVAIL